jgi:hypothetical protein
MLLKQGVFMSFNDFKNGLKDYLNQKYELLGNEARILEAKIVDVLLLPVNSIRYQDSLNCLNSDYKLNARDDSEILNSFRNLIRATLEEREKLISIRHSLDFDFRIGISDIPLFLKEMIVAFKGEEINIAKIFKMLLFNKSDNSLFPLIEEEMRERYRNGDFENFKELALSYLATYFGVLSDKDLEIFQRIIEILWGLEERISSKNGDNNEFFR